MNKKLSRLLQPSMAMYFVVLLLFAGGTLFLNHPRVAAAELLIIFLLFIYLRISNIRRGHAISDYIQTATDTLETASKGDIPFPMVLIHLNNGEIVWANNRFRQISGLKESILEQNISDIFPAFSNDWLAAGKPECPYDFQLGNRRYRIFGSIMQSRQEKNNLLLATLYLADMTELLQVKDEYIRSRPIVSIILIDNYDELMNNLPEGSIAKLRAELNDVITEWATPAHGLLRRLERNRFLFIFESRDLTHFADEKFSLLESIRNVVNPAGVAATVSIGIGKDGVTFDEAYNFAALSIEMSLSRGGDQAVIKDRYGFAFYGGRSKETDHRTKVRSRVIANSITELIGQCTHIFVMGHKNADLDSIGAAVGVCCICRKLGKRAKIVADVHHTQAKALMEQLLADPEYKDAFISGQDALLIADAKSLLIVVDTNRPDQVEHLPLLESLQRVMVIDHHRRAAEYIQPVVLSLHEPYASSASELVTELLQYSVDSTDVLKIEAQALLAGIVMDTKHFNVRTSERTFDAAAFLNRLNASTVDVKKMLQTDLQATIRRYDIIRQAKMYHDNIAICALETSFERTTAAQAADELLSITGIETSFVLYPNKSEVVICARSIGDVNVQVILETLGGGGNAATAGAQIANTDVPTVLQQLSAAIDKYYEE